MTSIPASEARKLLGKQKRRNKFNAKRVTVDGIEFDSTKEANRWMHLRALEKAGQISHLERQPRFKLYCGNEPIKIRSKGYPNGRHASVKFDFAYFDGQARVIEDVKGGKVTATEAYKIRKAIVEAMHPMVKIVEV